MSFSIIVCTDHGKQYKIGEQLQPNCSTRCTCMPGGVLSCETVPCSYDGPTCLATGDPHYKTFDGFWHHFQGTCEHVLTKSCDGDDFIISAGNIGHEGSPVSCVGLVRIRIPSENHEIVLERGSFGNITVNGAIQANLCDGVVYESDSVDVVRTGGYPNVFLKTRGVRLFYDGVYRVEITISTTLQGQVCGLCGTYNDNTTDDPQTPAGVVVTSVDEFGDSWLVPDPTTVGCEGGGMRKRNAPSVTECSNDVNIVSDAQTRCSVLLQDPFTSCHDVVNVTQFIANCEFDYCCCTETEREDCYCDALSSYASVCADAGAQPSNWRSMHCCKLIMFTFATGLRKLDIHTCDQN